MIFCDEHFILNKASLYPGKTLVSSEKSLHFSFFEPPLHKNAHSTYSKGKEIQMNSRQFLFRTMLLVLLDQLVKFWLFGKEFVLIPGVFAVETVKNTGLAMGIFSGNPYVALLLPFVSLVVLWYATHRYTLYGFSSFGLVCIVAGAIGNIIDRVFFCYVRDSFSLLFVEFYVFNVADVLVTTGVIALAIGVMFREKKEWVKK